MITNLTSLKNYCEDDYYKCKHAIMKYLVFKCNLSILSLDKDVYYFVKTDELRECLKKLPLDLKIVELFTRH